MTADLAISGEPDDTFGNGACSVTLATPKQYVAWWMYTKINYRYNSKSSYQLIWLF